MKNYRAWVKDEGRRFIAAVQDDFGADAEEHGGKSGRPNLLRWAEERGQLVEHAQEIAKSWSLTDVQFVNSNSPSRAQQAVGKGQALDAFVRDLARVVNQAWKRTGSH